MSLPPPPSHANMPRRYLGLLVVVLFGVAGFPLAEYENRLSDQYTLCHWGGPDLIVDSKTGNELFHLREHPGEKISAYALADDDLLLEVWGSIERRNGAGYRYFVYYLVHPDGTAEGPFGAFDAWKAFGTIEIPWKSPVPANAPGRIVSYGFGGLFFVGLLSVGWLAICGFLHGFRRLFESSGEEHNIQPDNQ